MAMTEGKVFSVSGLERLPRGTGIVRDDVMAGIYPSDILRVLCLGGLI